MHLCFVIDLLLLKSNKNKQKTVIAVNFHCLAEVQLGHVNLVSVKKTSLQGTTGMSRVLGMTSSRGLRSR